MQIQGARDKLRKKDRLLVNRCKHTSYDINNMKNHSNITKLQDRRKITRYFSLVLFMTHVQRLPISDVRPTFNLERFDCLTSSLSK